MQSSRSTTPPPPTPTCRSSSASLPSSGLVPQCSQRLPERPASAVAPRPPSLYTVPPMPLPLPDVTRERMPRHIAVIMDGNGRWAVRQGRERVFGHQEGAKTVRAIVTECAHLRKHLG